MRLGLELELEPGRVECRTEKDLTPWELRRLPMLTFLFIGTRPLFLLALAVYLALRACGAAFRLVLLGAGGGGGGGEGKTKGSVLRKRD
mmetsp:Transcript_37716/g.93400  ORF Transcript_37716/g.93400 Transcript_37716/m.93400 type:complete len:89 (+) Transcript_37716:1-267(+)